MRPGSRHPRIRRVKAIEELRRLEGVSTHDIASTQGYNPKTVLRWIWSGKLPATHVRGTRYRVAVRDLEIFLATRGVT